MWQTGKGESNNERGNGNENEAEREIENLGARLDAASTAQQPRPSPTQHVPSQHHPAHPDHRTLDGHRRHPAGHAAAHAPQQPRRQTLRADHCRTDAMAGIPVRGYRGCRTRHPTDWRTCSARRHRRGVRGCASRLAFGDISNHNRRFPETPASPSRRRRPMACPTRPTSTPAS